ncbi:hypothetical protein LguiA_001715 [Lonicera macranthoides]
MKGGRRDPCLQMFICIYICCQALKWTIHLQIAFQAFSDENFKGKSTSAEKDVPNSERTGQF